MNPVDASITVEVLIGASDRFGYKIAAMRDAAKHAGTRRLATV